MGKLQAGGAAHGGISGTAVTVVSLSGSQRLLRLGSPGVTVQLDVQHWKPRLLSFAHVSISLVLGLLLGGKPQLILSSYPKRAQLFFFSCTDTKYIGIWHSSILF